jgi:hypothetical protein
VALPALGFALLAATPFVSEFGDARTPAALYEAYIPWLAAAGAIGMLGGAWALYQNHRSRVVAAVTTAACCGLAIVQMLVTGFDSFAPARSSYYVVRQIESQLRPDLPFYSVGLYDQTLPFYLRRTVTLVLFRGELDMGISQEPKLWLPDLKAFEAAWRQQQRGAMAMLHPAYYDQLAAAGLPMQVLVKDARRVVVKTP